jgi:hypothetical protein
MGKNERRLVPLDDVVGKPPRWLWANRIPLGAVTILEGDPGLGKSSVAIDIAARVTVGKPMPNAQAKMNPAGVVLLQGEDNLGTTVKPALMAAGADIARVYAYDASAFRDRALALPDDMDVVEVAAAEVNALLVVVDPLFAFLRGNAASDTYVRRVMGSLTSLAERLDLAVLVVRHLVKGGGNNPLYRGQGGIGLIAAARSALVVADDPHSDDPHRHVLAQAKSNLGDAVSLAYRTRKIGDCVTVEWLGETEFTPKACVPANREDQSRLTEAAYVLYSVLVDGPVEAHEVARSAAKACVAKRTLERAKALVGVRSYRRGGGPGSRWYWELPRETALLRAFRERDLEELTDRLLSGDDDPPLPGDEWKHGEGADDGNAPTKS